MSPRSWQKTKHYTTPKLPWGININQIEPTLRDWLPQLEEIKPIPFHMPFGIYYWMSKIIPHIPVLKNHTPGITRVRFSEVPSCN